MKIVISYTSKHGGCKHMVERICAKLPCDVISGVVSNVANYDVCIVATSVYIGKLHKDAIAQVTLCMEQNTPVYVIWSGMNTKVDTEVLEADFTPEQRAYIKMGMCLGGTLNFPDMNFFERFVIKMINKKEPLLPTINVSEVYELMDESKLDQVIRAIHDHA